MFPRQWTESRHLAHAIIIAIRTEQTETLQIPIAQRKRPSNSGFDPAVSSPEYYLTPAPNDDTNRKALLAGRHLIILNTSSHTPSRYLYNSVGTTNGIIAVEVVP